MYGCVWGELCVMRGERVYCTHMSGTQPNTLIPSPLAEGVWTPNEDMNLVPKISHGLNSCRGRWPHSCVWYDVIAAQTDGWVHHRGVNVDFIRQQLLHSLQWCHAWNGDTGGGLCWLSVHHSLHSQFTICCCWFSAIGFTAYFAASLFSFADLQHSRYKRMFYVLGLVLYFG